MVYQDRNNIVSIVVGLAVNFYIISRLIDLNAAGAFDAPDAVNVWARTVVWVIPIAIAATIAGTIIFNIGYAIATGNENPSFVVDERDKNFETRGHVAVMIFAAFGIVAAIIIWLSIGPRWSASTSSSSLWHSALC